MVSDLLSEEGFFSPLWDHDELNNIPVFVVWIACCVPLTKKTVQMNNKLIFVFPVC